MSEHTIKVLQPYFDHVAEGRKPFEVRRNDRGYQAGDVLHLIEYMPERCRLGDSCRDTACPSCGRQIDRLITFVYSGDPRFLALEPGYVVLGLAPADVAPVVSGGAR